MTTILKTTVIVMFALFAFWPSLSVLADFVSPPDPAPAGCTTQITEDWSTFDSAPTIWSMPHTDKNYTPTPNCGMRITVQYTEIDANGNVDVIVNTWEYLGEDEYTFPDGTTIRNTAHAAPDGTITWVSYGTAPDGGKLTRGSVFNGTPTDPGTPPATGTPQAPDEEDPVPTAILPTPTSPPIGPGPLPTPTPINSYVCQYPPNSGISTDQCLFQYMPFVQTGRDFIIGPGPFPTATWANTWGISP